MPSYYITIGGKRYDRALYEEAREAIEGKGDGRISRADAEKLLARVLDKAPGSDDVYVDIEKETVELLRKTMAWTGAGDQHFRTTIRKVAALRSWELRAQQAASGKAIGLDELIRELGDNPIVGVTHGRRFELEAPCLRDEPPSADIFTSAVAELAPGSAGLRFAPRLTDTDSVPDLIVEEQLLWDGPYTNPERRHFADGFAAYVQRLMGDDGQLAYSYYQDPNDDPPHTHAAFMIAFPGRTDAILIQVQVNGS